MALDIIWFLSVSNIYGSNYDIIGDRKYFKRKTQEETY